MQSSELPLEGIKSYTRRRTLLTVLQWSLVGVALLLATCSTLFSLSNRTSLLSLGGRLDALSASVGRVSHEVNLLSVQVQADPQPIQRVVAAPSSPLSAIAPSCSCPTEIDVLNTRVDTVNTSLIILSKKVEAMGEDVTVTNLRMDDLEANVAAGFSKVNENVGAGLALVNDRLNDLSGKVFNGICQVNCSVQDLKAVEASDAMALSTRINTVDTREAEDVRTLTTRTDTLDTSLKSLTTKEAADISTVTTRVATLETKEATDVSTVGTRVAALETKETADVTAVKTDVATLNTKVTAILTDIASLWRFALRIDGSVKANVTLLQSQIDADKVPVGTLRLTYRNTPSSSAGWLRWDVGSIGSAGSHASLLASDTAHDLFVTLWNSVSQTYASVDGGRGASADADFRANKHMHLPLLSDRALAIVTPHMSQLLGGDDGLECTGHVLGQTDGALTRTLTVNELPAHQHALTTADYPILDQPRWGYSRGQYQIQRFNVQKPVTITRSAGTGKPFSVLPPTSYLAIEVKL